jgi:hypothetical protein
VTAHPHVVVRVQRSGGFAGISRDWTADTAELTTDQAAELRDLVVAAVTSVAAAVAAAVDDAVDEVPDLVRDGFDYLVEAQVGRRRHEWQGATAAVPAVRQLVEHVRRVAFEA